MVNSYLDVLVVTYNGRMRQFVVLDSKGITTWSKDAIEHTGKILDKICDTCDMLYIYLYI